MREEEEVFFDWGRRSLASVFLCTEVVAVKGGGVELAIHKKEMEMGEWMDGEKGREEKGSRSGQIRGPTS